MKALIYQLKSESGKSYIGSTTNTLVKRMSVHYAYLEKEEHPNHILQAAYNKYGEFIEIVLEEFEYTELSEVITKEQFWLDKIQPEYNILKKAYVQKMTPIIKEKISNTLKGRKHSQERLEAMRLGREKAMQLAKSNGIPYITQSIKGREARIEAAKKRVSPVIAFTWEGYIEFDSVDNASKIMDVSTSTIHASIRNGKPDRFGFWYLHI